MTLDLASLESVRGFARDYAVERRPPLRALICNAATQIVSGRTFTKDGFETTFGVNHLGHFLLVNLMLAQMTPPARIIVSAAARTILRRRPGCRRRFTGARASLHGRMKIPSRSMTSGERLAGARTPRRSCATSCSLTNSSAVCAPRTGTKGLAITVNAFDPGLMPGTGLARDYGRFARFAWRFVLPALRPFVPNVNSVARSGKSLAGMVIEPRFARISGKYFQGARDVPSSKDSYDPAMATELWESSESMVRLTPERRFCGSIGSLGGIRVPRNTYLLVFSVDYILLGLTLVNC